MDKVDVSKWFDGECHAIVRANNASCALGVNSLRVDESHAETVHVNWSSSGVRAQCGVHVAACEELVPAMLQLKRRVESALEAKIKSSEQNARDHQTRLEEARASLSVLKAL